MNKTKSKLKTFSAAVLGFCAIILFGTGIYAVGDLLFRFFYPLDQVAVFKLEMQINGEGNKHVVFDNQSGSSTYDQENGYIDHSGTTACAEGTDQQCGGTLDQNDS